MPEKLLFNKNCVYHSYLKRHSPLVVKLATNGVQQSKYRDDEKIIYIDEFRGYDDTGRYYTIENERCAKKLEAAPKGEWIKLSAIGRDEDDADLVIEKVEGGDTSFGTFTPNGRNYSKGTILEDYLECIATVQQISGAVDEDGNLTDAGQKHAATLMINWERTKYKKPLHPGMIEDEKEPVEDEAPTEENWSDSMHPELRAVLEELRDELSWEGQSHDDYNLADVKTRIDVMLDEGAPDKDARRTIGWCRKELEHQTRQEEEAVEAGFPDDDLPF